LQPGLTSIIPRTTLLTAQMERRYTVAAAAAAAQAPVVVYEPVAVAEVSQNPVSGSLAMAEQSIEFVPEESEHSGRLSGRYCPACMDELEYEAYYCSQCGSPIEMIAYPSSGELRASDELRAQVDVARPEPDTIERVNPAKPARNTLHLVSPPPDTVAADPAELLAPPVAPRRPVSALLQGTDIGTIALVCACAALVAAVGVHLFSPRIIEGFTPAEVDLKIQLRAAQWLLVGILSALVGLLARR
jgi:uncharacterized OB-fold protein